MTPAPERTDADEAALMATPDAVTDMSPLLRLAVEKDLDVDKLGKLVELHHELLDRQARQEFNTAFAAFQVSCPDILARSESKQFTRTTAAGTNQPYRFADLHDISIVIKPLLADHGLATSWDSVTEGEVLTVTCILRHVAGHSSKATFASPVESKAGASEQQKHAIAMTYAKRQSLVAVLGLTITDEDRDGALPDAGSAEPVTATQLGTLVDLLREVNADEARFLKHFGIETLEQLPQGRFASARAMLESKRP